MIKFIHTADIHLGREFDQFDEKGEERREDIRLTFRRIASLAIEKGVNLFLISGDLFNSPNPSKKDLEFVFETFRMLSDNNVVIFITPGNHDYYIPDGIWDREFSSLGRNLHIFTSSEFETIGLERFKVSVAGCAYNRHQSNSRLFERPEFKISQQNSILLFHGSYEYPNQEYRDQPFSLEELKRLPFNYIALGHYHRHMEIFSEEKRVCFYPGVPEGLNLDERNAGKRYVILGEISDHGEVNITIEEVQRKIIEILNIDCTHFQEKDTLEMKIREHAGDNKILKLNLTGKPTMDILETIDELQERFSGYFYMLKINKNQLDTPIDIPVDPRFIIGRFCRKLEDQIDRAENEEEKQLLKTALNLGINAIREAEKK
ncbi:MAG: metallophosphoesterase [Thermodesulfobacteriota bacterium]